MIHYQKFERDFQAIIEAHLRGGYELEMNLRNSQRCDVHITIPDLGSVLISCKNLGTTLTPQWTLPIVYRNLVATSQAEETGTPDATMERLVELFTVARLIARHWGKALARQ